MMQLDMFPEALHLRCIDPREKQAAVLHDGGRADAVRRMDAAPRVGPDRQRPARPPQFLKSAGEALDALAELAKKKRKRGYR